MTLIQSATLEIDCQYYQSLKICSQHIVSRLLGRFVLELTYTQWKPEGYYLNQLRNLHNLRKLYKSLYQELILQFRNIDSRFRVIRISDWWNV